jgi:hypothetical protein
MNKQKLKGLWIPAEILLNEELTDKEKLILAMILYLSEETSSCFASNKYIANIVNVTADRVSKIISSLRDKNYIKVKLKYKTDSKEIEERQILPIVENINRCSQKHLEGIDINNYSDSQKQPYPIGDNDKDIINNINDNIEIIEDSKPLTIKKALMHADIITLSTGLNELLYKLQNENLDSYQMYKYIDNLIEDIDDLIDIIKKYCKEDIFILGYYNPYVNKNVSDDIDKYIKYANNKLIELSKDEEIIYIDLYNILKNNSQVFTSVDSHYPNIDGYKLISREIIEKIEKKVIKTLKEM